jgi:sugar lactone lactonase YvrE
MVLGCLALVLPGCDGAAEGNTLPIESFNSQTLSAEGAFLPAPRAMTFSPEGELYILDDAGRVLVYGPDGECRRQWWMPDYDVGKPEGVVVLRDGRIAVADTHYFRVVFFDSEGHVLGTFGENGNGPGQFIYPADVEQDAEGNLYVAEYGGNDRVQKFTPDGEFLLEFGQPGTLPGEFQRASGLACYDDTVYVSDVVNSRVQAFSRSGEFLRVVADAQTCGLDYPYDVTTGPDGTLYVAEFRPGRVSRFTLEGELVGHFGTTGRGENQFWTPWGVAVDSDGRILIADTGNRRIVELIP